MLKKVKRLLSLHIVEYFINNPELFSDRPQKKELLNQFIAIRNYRRYEKNFDRLNILKDEIEKNYNMSTNSWEVNNDCLFFSDVFTVPITVKGFVFQSLIVLDEFDIEGDFRGPLEFYDCVENNFLICISVPNLDNMSQDIFFATPKNNMLIQNFLTELSKKPFDVKKRVFNSFLLENNEELYFSKDYIDLFSEDEKSILEKRVEGAEIISRGTGLKNKFSFDPKVDFFK